MTADRSTRRTTDGDGAAFAVDHLGHQRPRMDDGG